MATTSNSPSPRESSAAFLQRMKSPLERLHDQVMAIVRAELPPAKADQCEIAIDQSLLEFVQAWGAVIEREREQLATGAAMLQDAFELNRDFNRTRTERAERN